MQIKSDAARHNLDNMRGTVNEASGSRNNALG